MGIKGKRAKLRRLLADAEHAETAGAEADGGVRRMNKLPKATDPSAIPQGR